MTKEQIIKERIKYFLLGLLTVIAAIFLMGTTHHNDVVIDNGRFQISAWGDSKTHGAFIVDSVSGKTKIVYQKKELGDGKSVKISNLNMPFSRMN